MENLKRYWKSRIQELVLSREQYNKVGDREMADEKHIEICTYQDCLNDLEEELSRTNKAPQYPKPVMGWTNLKKGLTVA